MITPAHHIHIRECNAYAQSGPDALAGTVRFVLATIRQPLETVPRILRDYRQHGPASRYAMATKRAGLAWLQSNAAALYDSACRANAAADDDALLLAFLQVPGLGLVKAGFAAQLFAGRIGCIDGHNARLYSAPQYAYRPATMSTALQARKRAAYIADCHAYGGSSALWLHWCAHVASLRPDRWQNARAVSAFHPSTIKEA